jgi:hypothetical protein
MKPAARATIRRRPGITVTELVVATGLATMLLMLLASAWANFGRPALEVEARARIEQEGILAAQSLACDFGGFLADTPGRTGKMQTGQSAPFQASNPRWDLGNPDVLLLNFYGSATSDSIVIGYQLHGNVLVRTNYSTNVATTVARYVTGFSAVADPDNFNQVLITLTIAYQNFTTTFTLIGVAPSS